jgi:hypothetical protein
MSSLRPLLKILTGTLKKSLNACYNLTFLARNTLAAEAKQSLSFLFKHLSKYVAVL